MNCPMCRDISLIMSDRQGIEIDYCSECRGVWLDRGELYKTIERSSASVTQSKDRYDERGLKQHSHASQNFGYYKKKKIKKGVLVL